MSWVVRLVKHLEDRTLAALTDFYAVVFPRNRVPLVVKDLSESIWMSSWLMVG